MRQARAERRETRANSSEVGSATSEPSGAPRLLLRRGYGGLVVRDDSPYLKPINSSVMTLPCASDAPAEARLKAAVLHKSVLHEPGLSAELTGDSIPKERPTDPGFPRATDIQ